MDGEQIARELSDRVRELVEDAQRQAGEIIAKAEQDAKRIRESAEGEANAKLAQVRSALDDLQGKLGGSPQAEVTPGPVTVPEPAPPDVPEPTPDPVPDPVPGPEPVPEPSPEPVPEPEPPAEGANGTRSPDKAAARLVAMKMALDGSSREEIEGHLAEHYELEHSEKLLDDVMSRAKA
jgi:cell division septum initiation protein DivIVA